jgi:hypothetical protein
MLCELRFHGESYGWEAQFLERGDLVYGRGGFVAQAPTVQWAEQEPKRWSGNGDHEGITAPRLVQPPFRGSRRVEVETR